jgi:hypothetical protein
MSANAPPDRQAANRPPRLLIVYGGDHAYQGYAPGRVRYQGLSDVDQLLSDAVPANRLNLGKDLHRALLMLKQRGSGGDLSAYHCVLNLVSDADTCPITLQALSLLLRGYGGRVINRPEAVLRSSRDQVANALSGVPGLMVPKVVRFRGGAGDDALEAVAGLSFPIIVRQPGTHTGRTMVVVDDEAAFLAAVTDAGEYFATEFVDYRSADGLYRKYRIWSFGGRQVFRHLATTNQWNVHVTPGNEFMYDRPDLIEEEVRLMERPEGAFPDEVHAIVATIGERLGLDYFGVDFAFLPDGRMVLFEANAAMNYFPMVPDPRFQFRERLLAPGQEAFMAMLGLQDAEPGGKQVR